MGWIECLDLGSLRGIILFGLDKAYNGMQIKAHCLSALSYLFCPNCDIVKFNNVK